MFFAKFKPAESLAHLVDNIWLYEGYEAEHSNERILPSGTIEIVFNLREDELRIYQPDDPTECSRYKGAVVSGPYRNGFMSDSEEEAFIMGVHFKPGGAHPFLGISAAEISDRHVDLDRLWGPAAIDLRDQLCEASTADERFRLIQENLIRHISKPLERHYAVSLALDSIDKTNDLSVRRLAKDAGLSERRFIQVFKSEVGMTPKLLSRIQRFQSAKALIEQTEMPDWPTFAVQCGYFDQSHLIRDFREFAGTTPEAFLRRHEQFSQNDVHLKTNHLPVI